MKFSKQFNDTFAEYKKTYMEYMGYSKEELPSDEVLLIVALRYDIDKMKEGKE